MLEQKEQCNSLFTVDMELNKATTYISKLMNK